MREYIKYLLQKHSLAFLETMVIILSLGLAGVVCCVFIMVLIAICEISRL